MCAGPAEDDRDLQKFAAGRAPAEFQTADLSLILQREEGFWNNMGLVPPAETRACIEEKGAAFAGMSEDRPRLEKLLRKGFQHRHGQLLMQEDKRRSVVASDHHKDHHGREEHGRLLLDLTKFEVGARRGGPRNVDTFGREVVSELLLFLYVDMLEALHAGDGQAPLPYIFVLVEDYDRATRVAEIFGTERTTRWWERDKSNIQVLQHSDEGGSMGGTGEDVVKYADDHGGETGTTGRGDGRVRNVIALKVKRAENEPALITLLYFENPKEEVDDSSMSTGTSSMGDPGFEKIVHTSLSGGPGDFSGGGKKKPEVQTLAWFKELWIPNKDPNFEWRLAPHQGAGGPLKLEEPRDKTARGQGLILPLQGFAALAWAQKTDSTSTSSSRKYMLWEKNQYRTTKPRGEVKTIPPEDEQYWSRGKLKETKGFDFAGQDLQWDAQIFFTGYSLTASSQLPQGLAAARKACQSLGNLKFGSKDGTSDTAERHILPQICLDGPDSPLFGYFPSVLSGGPLVLPQPREMQATASKLDIDKFLFRHHLHVQHTLQSGYDARRQFTKDEKAPRLLIDLTGLPVLFSPPEPDSRNPSSSMAKAIPYTTKLFPFVRENFQADHGAHKAPQGSVQEGKSSSRQPSPFPPDIFVVVDSRELAREVAAALQLSPDSSNLYRVGGVDEDLYVLQTTEDVVAGEKE
ncbi:unnamed protein product [Amoebophrya sp. A120]|nr:unnamed protein product [Amoebophrya sp. A120]|eukprot:GSA120T00004516001.1